MFLYVVYNIIFSTNFVFEYALIKNNNIFQAFFICLEAVGI